MGLISKILGGPATVTALADAASGVAEVFTPSATKRMELSAAAQMAALKQLGEEYGQANAGWFDSLVDGLNRLPRPLLAFGTIGMFIYAMVDPSQFAQRMVGLNAVPEPLWWLLGAVVAFYFGARETYYFRNRAGIPPMPAAQNTADENASQAGPGPENRGAAAENAALSDWRRGD